MGSSEWRLQSPVNICASSVGSTQAARGDTSSSTRVDVVPGAARQRQVDENVACGVTRLVSSLSYSFTSQSSLCVSRSIVEWDCKAVRVRNGKAFKDSTRNYIPLTGRVARCWMPLDLAAYRTAAGPAYYGGPVGPARLRRGSRLFLLT
jgi:hypothetical protein